ncbi:hypothetical protein BASA81_012724 [Batrachochytrium salamandrivorans]|nr:hypothetical protein BASA81_012724 [Batrachochytrium salamandrivorans]
MIVYDHTRFHGWGLLLHASGSALFNPRSVIPALLSAGLAALFANYEPIQTWLGPRMVNGAVVFSGIQFLVSLIVVNRVREASTRFHATHESYGRLNFTLQRLAVFFTSCIDSSDNLEKYPEEMYLFRLRFLRWIRAIHVLALEEFQGFETPKYRMGTLLFTEEIVLFRESRRAARVIRWLSRGYAKNRLYMAPSIAADMRMQGLIDEVNAAYGATLVVSNEIYPFPLAQAALFCVVAYAFWSPLAFGIMLPNSYFLAPLICFTSVWISFGANLSGQLLEWPFDGKANDLPLKYYSVRFVKEIAEVEFGIDAPLVNVPFAKLFAGADFTNCDYVVPKERNNLSGRRNTREWLQRATRDLDEVAQNRKRLRHRLKSVGPKHEYDTGISMSEIRASGKFKTML